MAHASPAQRLVWHFGLILVVGGHLIFVAEHLNVGPDLLSFVAEHLNVGPDLLNFVAEHLNVGPDLLNFVAEHLNVVPDLLNLVTAHLDLNHLRLNVPTNHDWSGPTGVNSAQLLTKKKTPCGVDGTNARFYVLSILQFCNRQTSVYYL